MEKMKMNYYVDLVLVVCLIIISITGTVLFFAFSNSINFLGVHKSVWRDWHAYVGLAMVVLMFLHFFLHRAVFKGMARRYAGKR